MRSFKTVGMWVLFGFALIATQNLAISLGKTLVDYLSK